MSQSIIGYLILVVLGFFGGFFFAKKDVSLLHKELLGKTEAYQQLSDSLALLEIDYKEQSDVVAAYEKELALKPKATVISVSQSRFGVKGKAFEEKGGQKFYEIYLPDGDKKGPALGVVVLGDKVTVRAYDHDYEIVQAIERDGKTGRFKILAKGYYVLKEGNSSWKDKQFPLSVTGGEATVDPTFGAVSKKKFWLKPRVTIGIDLTYPEKDLLPGVKISPLSYGEHPDVSDWRFLSVGVSGNQKTGPVLSVAPIVMNLKNGIKFFRNTYIGPVINLDNSCSYGATIQFGF